MNPLRQEFVETVGRQLEAAVVGAILGVGSRGEGASWSIALGEYLLARIAIF